MNAEPSISPDCSNAEGVHGQPVQKSRTVWRTGWKRVREPLRVTLAVLLVVWLLSTGRIQTQVFRSPIQQLPSIVGALAILYGTILLMSWRWSLLLKAQHLRVGAFRCFSINMIGLAFGFISPGATGGDIAKCYYIGSASTNNKIAAITTVIVDRVLGLLSLLLLAVIGIAVNGRTLYRDPAVRTYCFAVVAMFLSGFVLCTATLLASDKITDLLRQWSPRFRLLQFVSGAVEALGTYRRVPRILVQALLLSLITHLAVCYVFLLLFNAGGRTISFSALVVTVPVALISFAIPLTPGAIGVGQVAFFALFQITAARGADAATALTLYQILYGLISATGIVVYVMRRRSKNAELSADHLAQ